MTNNLAGTGTIFFKNYIVMSWRNRCLLVFYLSFFAVLVCCNIVFGEVSEEEFPFVGIVTGNNVNVRAGENLNYEVLCQLDREDLVSVTGRSYQWYKIELPLKGTCFVSKLHIEKGEVFGISKVDCLNIRSRPDTNSTVIGQLKAGDRVTILKELSEWYQIVPTQDCVGWIHSRFVNFYSTIEEYQPQKVQLKVVEEKFQQLSKRYEQQLSRPFLEEMELDSLLAEFEKFVTEYPASEYLPPARQMIGHIKLKIAEAQPIMATERLEKEMEEVSGPEPAGLGPPCAEGKVEDLGRFFNRPATHKLTKEGHLVCYLKSENLDLNKYVNRQVSVWGKTSHLKRWSHPVITVEDIRAVK